MIISNLKVLFLVLCSTTILIGCACSPEIGMMLDSQVSGHHIIVHLDKQKAYLYKGNMLVGISPVSTGREGYNTPAGSYYILSKDLNHRSSVYGAYLKNGKIIQSGVDTHKDTCPLGADFIGAPMPYYLQIAPAYGLHAGYLPGYPASHGCIRLPEAWAKRFYYASQDGSLVMIYR